LKEVAELGPLAFFPNLGFLKTLWEIEHQILPAALRVLKALGYSEEDILKTRAPSLGMWLKKS